MANDPLPTRSLLFSGEATGPSVSPNGVGPRAKQPSLLHDRASVLPTGGADEDSLEVSGIPSIIAWLRKHNLPITRENYRDALWDHAADGEDGWTAEHEDTMPSVIKT